MSLRSSPSLTQHRGHRIVTEPTVEPVFLDRVREIIRLPPVEDDPFISDCITQARMMFEAATGIACITQTWKLTLDRWPTQSDMWWDGVREMAISELYEGKNRAEITLPKYPLISVDGVTTYNEGDVATSLTVANVFSVDTNSFPGRLGLRSGQAWPVALRHQNAIEIEYTAGFGATAASVPVTLQRAIGNAAAFLYENRGTGCTSGDVLSKSGALHIGAEFAELRI